jgi:hypothetical protein
LRARYYDPTVDRFTQMDPVAGNNFDPQSLHKYVYAADEPVNRIDPTWHLSQTEILITSVIIGLVAGMYIGGVVAARRGLTTHDLAFWNYVLEGGILRMAAGYFAGLAAVYFAFMPAAGAGAGLGAQRIQQIVQDTDRVDHAFDHWKGILEHRDDLVPIIQQVLAKPEKYSEGFKLGAERAFGWATKVEVAGVRQWVAGSIYETGPNAGRLGTVVAPTAKQLAAATDQ